MHQALAARGYYSDEFASEGFYPGGCGTGSCDSGSCSDGYCGECCDDGGYGCGDDCGYGCDSGCGDSWWDCLGMGSDSRWFFTADYLYVRADFSESVAYIQRDQSNLDNRTDFVHELDFQYESSYRVGGGYRLGCCDEELRFMFTRLSSNADTIAPVGTQDMPVLVPYETTSPDGPTLINADVDTKSFDLDYRKTIPLGGTQCCELRRCLRRVLRSVRLRRRLRVYAGVSGVGHHLVGRRAVCRGGLEPQLRHVRRRIRIVSQRRLDAQLQRRWPARRLGRSSLFRLVATGAASI